MQKQLAHIQAATSTLLVVEPSLLLDGSNCVLHPFIDCYEQKLPWAAASPVLMNKNKKLVCVHLLHDTCTI